MFIKKQRIWYFIEFIACLFPGSFWAASARHYKIGLPMGDVQLSLELTLACYVAQLILGASNASKDTKRWDNGTTKIMNTWEVSNNGRFH